MSASAPDETTHVLVMLAVPETLRGRPFSDVRYVLGRQREELLDILAQGIVQFFNQPPNTTEIRAILENDARRRGER